MSRDWTDGQVASIECSDDCFAIARDAAGSVLFTAPEDQMDAVVKAVNAHDKLVTALEAFVKDAEDWVANKDLVDNAAALLKTLEEQDKGEEDND